MLICVTPEDQAAKTKGGETRVHLSPDHAVVSRATITPGGALLFRKGLLHEALPLLAGSKEVVCLDLWATRKDSDAIVLVTFPEEKDHPGSVGAPLQVGPLIPVGAVAD
jgi:hypothetical protein